MAIGKIVVFLTLVLLGASSTVRTDRNNLILYFLLGLCAVFGLITGTLTEGVSGGVETFRNFVEPLLWLIALNGMSPRACQKFLALLKVFLAVGSVIIFYVILAYFGLVADLETPSELLAGNYRYVGGSTISNSGFTGARTGWGVVVGPTAIFAAVLLMEGAKRWSARTIFAVVIVGAAVLSTMITGARGGAFAIVAAVALGVMSGQRSRYTNLIVVAGLIGMLVYLGAFSIVPDLFFRNLEGSGSVVERLDVLSTGRISSYVQGIQHWISSPFIGVGPTNALVWVNGGEELPVHNVWLRVLAESGLFVGVPVFWMTGRWLKLMRDRPVLPGLNDSTGFLPPSNVRLVLVCGLVLALVEPAVLFGSFNSNLAIWTAIWMLMKREALFESVGSRKIRATHPQTKGRVLHRPA
jgi:hypothetical protein